MSLFEKAPIIVEDYVLNSVNMKKFVDIKGICKNNNQQFKLFMYGDAPSKLDRAIYFAIKDVTENLEEYLLLNDWYSYISTCNEQEMSKWKTPMR